MLSNAQSIGPPREVILVQTMAPSPVSAQKVTRQVIRISAAEAKKIGYSRGGQHADSIGTLIWDKFQNSNSWRSNEAVEHRLVKGEVAEVPFRELSDSHSSSAPTASTSLSLVVNSQDDGSQQDMVYRQQHNLPVEGIYLADKRDFGRMKVEVASFPRSGNVPIRLEPHIPGMSPPPAKTASSQSQYSQPRPRQYEQQLQSTGMSTAVSSTNSVSSGGAQEARVIQPVRYVMTERPPRLADSSGPNSLTNRQVQQPETRLSPKKSMKQVQDSLQSIVMGVGGLGGIPSRPGIHTLESTLDGVNHALSKPERAPLQISSNVRWSAASRLQASLRMKLRRAHLWSRDVFTLVDLIVRRSQLVLKHGMPSPMAPGDIAREIRQTTRRIIELEYDLTKGRASRKRPPATWKMPGMTCFFARSAAAKFLTAAAKRVGKPAALALALVHLGQQRRVQRIMVPPAAVWRVPVGRIVGTPDRLQGTPCVPGSPVMVSPQVTPHGTPHATPQGTPNGSRRYPKPSGSPKAPSLIQGANKAFAGLPPTGQISASHANQRYSNGTSLARPSTQRPLFGVVPLQDVEKATQDGTLSDLVRPSRGGVEVVYDEDELLMLDMARAHIASGLLEDNGGTKTVWKVQEC